MRMAAFGMGGVFRSTALGSSVVSSCSVLAPPLAPETLQSRRVNPRWVMITKKQRRLKKEAKRKKQEARDEEVFLQIDEIVEKLQEGKMEQVIQLMEKVHEGSNLNEPMCNYLSNALAKNVPAPRGLKYVEMVLAEQRRREIPYRTATYNTMIRICSLQENYEQSVWWYNRMEEVGARRDVSSYNQMLLAAANEGDIEQLERTWTDLKSEDRKGTTATFNFLIKAYDLKNDLRGVRGAYRRMKENGAVPNWWTYDALIRVYGRNGQFDLVESVLKEMERNDTTPDARVFSRIIRLCAEAGDTQAVKWWLNRMLDQRIQPDSEILSMMVRAYVLAEDLNGAEEIITYMKQRSVNPGLQALNALMMGYSTRKDAVNAKKVLVRMSRYNVLPDIWTFNTLLKVMFDSKDIAGAENVFAGMHRKGIAPNMTTFQILTSSFSKNEEFTKAIGILDEMLKFELVPSLDIFRGLARAMLKSKQFEKAPLLVRVMKRTETFEEDALVIQLLQGTLESDGDAMPILKSMRSISTPFTADVLGSVLQSLVKVDDWERIRDILKSMNRCNLRLEDRFFESLELDGATLQSAWNDVKSDPDSEEFITLEELEVEDAENAEEPKHEIDNYMPPENDPVFVSQDSDRQMSDSGNERTSISDEDTLPWQRDAQSDDEEEDEDDVYLEMASRDRLYGAILAALNPAGEQEMTSLNEWIPQSPWDLNTATRMRQSPRKQREKKSNMPNLDYKIMPRRSEMFEDAGR